MSDSQDSPGPTRKLALMIDGDNAQASLVEEVTAEAAKHGTITVRWIYGNWTTPQLSGWKQVLQREAIQPRQQFAYTTGKNATDSALIIDAMDLLHSGRVDGFCIVSSDSDFTRLATRIREQGLFAMGIGRPDTPQPFVKACEVFVQTTNIAREGESQAKADKGGSSAEAGGPKKGADWVPLVREAIDAAEGSDGRPDGWVLLSAVGSYIRKLDPAFDPRTFKHKTLWALVKSRPEAFQTRSQTRNGGASVIHVRAVD